ncbi:UDP-N-acetylmuramoyl-L-alanyl-D-glutamate--2,6-diaminopimelate ligase [Corynebacterium meitnerae]|uniref:UDP-N-acetylmuramoyl-L-alanyl-D-glutamate--2,6-diaminopimelate ligase n=1 Tax=Corynebacterium meitnerae TaxID=2913498 RepID=A0A9X3RKV1_9CORY|nr:UDP-N-acetylmuramoyl-L-alanyl-D-glutamate--2,6-diaminopimelate ligase [Corynebacterium meitnerae]MCZ9293238.1 UDP-N-acetylmuramoyl-L-alanyl-D-glutamate--2,6-diaminopimelate ligase [Corynebacterium meitnerae]
MSNHMTINAIAEIAGGRVENAENAAAVDINAISLDSRAVTSGAMFAALPGTRTHGAAFAYDSAASAVLTDEDGWAHLKRAGEARPVVVVKHVRDILGDVASAIYGHPSSKLTVLGVTGTSGKTTTTYMLEAGLRAAGKKVGLIGTTGTRIMGEDVPTSLTTPEAPKLQELFAEMVARGVTHVVMEVSSHALVLGRVGGTQFTAAGFTNLSQDHLDFHPTMEEYFGAKALLFDDSLKASVICVDDEWGEKMAARAHNVIRVGTKSQDNVDCSARLLSTTDSGAQDVELVLNGTAHQFRLPLPGAFNVANAALATALANSVGVDVERFLSGIEDAAVPGRMERINSGQEFIAVVDYAHKPAAIAAALTTLREQVNGRIGVVVGAGGDRDQSKRAPMGEEAAKRADLVIITDDNPRSEDPATIREAVRAGAEKVEGPEVREIGSRSEAIKELVAWAQPGDAVIVVGKGHEVGQIIGDVVHHFDDREEVRAVLANLGFKEDRP